MRSAVIPPARQLIPAGSARLTALPCDIQIDGGACRRGAGKVERVPVEGEPVKSLIGALEEHQADLLVVGNQGLSTIAGRLLGSVPAAVARRAPCDVLIVHTVG